MSCPGPAAGGVGLLAGTIVIDPNGNLQSVSPQPSPFFTPEPDDVRLPIAPGTVVAVNTIATPGSSDTRVLTPIPGGILIDGQPYQAFRALAPGCVALRWGGVSVTVAVRSPVS